MIAPAATRHAVNAEAGIRADGFQIVHVRAGHASNGAGPMVDNFRDAIDRVASGGTIRVHDGTYDVAEVVINKPVTIEPNGGAAPLIRTRDFTGFRITGFTEGTLTIRNLTFEVLGSRGIVAFGSYGEVIVEDSRFTAVAGPPRAGGPPTGFEAIHVFGAGASPNAHFVARRNTVSGGHHGLVASVGNADFIGNTLSGFATGGIQFDNNASGRIADNTISECGAERCIGAFNSVRGVTIANNVVSNAHPRRVRSAIQAFNGNVTIEDNQVIGTGGEGRNLQDHPFEFAIDVNGLTNVTIARNVMGGASTGITVAFVARGLVDQNRVDPCGAQNCIVVFGTTNNADVRVTRNILRSIPERRTFFALHSNWHASSGTLSFTDNDVSAPPPGDPTSPATYALDIGFQNSTWVTPGAEGIPRGAAVEFSRNRITNAGVGARAFHGGVIEGRDNVFTRIFGEVFGAHDRGINLLQFNDVIGYEFPMGAGGSPVADEPHRGTLEITCNYWGGDAPWNVPPNIPASAYTPYATSPIAGTGATSCTGS